MATTRKTTSRIIAAATELMIEQKSPEIEMVQVATAAGISRTTLYRHFPTREALLAGVFEDTIQQYRSAMYAALDARPAIKDRIPALVEFLENWLIEGRFLKVYETDAALMLKLTHRIIPSSVDIILEALGPVFDIAEVVNGEPLDRTMIAHMFVHFSTSLIIFPPDATQPRPAELMASMLHALLRMPARPSPR